MSRFHRQIPGGMRAWETIRRQALDRDGWRCQKCGKAGAMECHHRTPLSLGGGNEPENLETLCRGCHIQLHREQNRIAKPVNEWDLAVDELLTIH